MYTQAILISALVAITEARFGQEQTPIAAISALSAFGTSGQASTLSGQSISFLLAAANPCGKLQQADLIVKTLGTDPQVIAAARALAGAEQNFNPFVVSVPSICSDPTLPATAELRGVVPLIDPAVTGADKENANAATSLTTPFTADGLSVAEIMIAQGFSNFTTKALDGTVGGGAASGAASVAATTAAAAASSSAVVSEAIAITSSASSESVAACVGATTFITMTKSASAAASTAAASTAATTAAASSNATTSTTGTTDFGGCNPAMSFALGRTGRKATEGTFLPADAKVAAGQQDALNPNIITNAICNNLINNCGLTKDSPGETACLAAKAVVAGLTTKDQSTADAFNSALGVSA